MTEQEQIDYLKREIKQLEQKVDHILYAMSLSLSAISEPPPNPACGKCYTQLFDGMTCQETASECPCGIGNGEDRFKDETGR